ICVRGLLTVRESNEIVIPHRPRGFGGLVYYASSYAFSSAATSSLTISIIASITACTFFGFLSLMSSMKRLGTICQVIPNGSVIQPHCSGVAPALMRLFQYSSTSSWSLQSTKSEKPLENLKYGPPL